MKCFPRCKPISTGMRLSTPTSAWILTRPAQVQGDEQSRQAVQHGKKRARTPRLQSGDVPRGVLGLLGRPGAPSDEDPRIEVTG